MIHTGQKVHSDAWPSNMTLTVKEVFRFDDDPESIAEFKEGGYAPIKSLTLAGEMKTIEVCRPLVTITRADVFDDLVAALKMYKEYRESGMAGRASRAAQAARVALHNAIDDAIEKADAVMASEMVSA